MFGSDILDVAVGLVFVYLLASLIVSTVTELLSGWLGWRANKLLDGVRNLINSPGAEDWAQKLYEHPLIKGMSPLPTKVFVIGKFQLAPLAPGPSYIPARTFALAMIDILSKSQAEGKSPLENIEDFLAMHAATYNVFTIFRHLTTARIHRLFRAEALAVWREAAGACA